MSGKYDDIINLPHHQSSTRPHMSAMDRAAQFSPFAALSGHGDAVKETARLTDQRIDLSNDEIAHLDEMLRQLRDSLEDQPKAAITYFVPDRQKEGGAYVTEAGELKRINDIDRMLVMVSGTAIPIEDIVDIDIIFDTSAKAEGNWHRL